MADDKSWFEEKAEQGAALQGAKPSPRQWSRRILQNVIAHDKQTGKHVVVSQSTAETMDPNKYDFILADENGNPQFDSAAEQYERDNNMEFGSMGSNTPMKMPLTNEQRRRVTKASLSALGAGVASFFVPELALPGAAARVAPLVSSLLRGGIASGGAASGSAAGDLAFGMPVSVNDMRESARNEFGGAMLGEGIARGAKPAARFFMTKALRPTGPMMADSPTLVDDALEMRTQVRQAGAPTVEATAVKRAAGREIQSLIDAGDNAGLRVDMQDVMPRLLALRDKLDAQDATGRLVAQLDDFINEFARRNSGGWELGLANERKKGLQRNARRVFRAEKAGAAVEEPNSVRAQAEAAVAKDARTAINTALERANLRSTLGLNINQLNDRYRRARSVERATARAQNIQPSRLENAMGGLQGAGAAFTVKQDPAAAVVGSVIGSILNNPQLYSKYANLLNHPAFMQWARTTTSAGTPLFFEAVSDR
jgi:hypothetical protein